MTKFFYPDAHLIPGTSYEQGQLSTQPLEAGLVQTTAESSGASNWSSEEQRAGTMDIKANSENKCHLTLEKRPRENEHTNSETSQMSSTSDLNLNNSIHDGVDQAAKPEPTEKGAFAQSAELKPSVDANATKERESPPKAPMPKLRTRETRRNST